MGKPRSEVVRFAVGGPDEPRSLVWRIWTGRGTSDLYISGRLQGGDWKVSLHESGDWRFALTRECYYIESFLARHADDIHGHVLEIGDASYTREFGGERVTVSDVLHVDESNPRATIVADLSACGEETVADGAEARDECNNCEARLDPSHVGPCPSCGERSGKTVYMSAAGMVLGSASASLTVIKWWQKRYKVLLDTARELRDQGHPEAAIVMAQTACEVCTEAVLTEALRQRVGDDAVGDRITGSRRNYDPRTDWVKEWYETLFGHRIQDEPFWQSFGQHAARRHRVVHRGEEATVQEADASIKAVDAAIQHLLKNRS